MYVYNRHLTSKSGRAFKSMDFSVACAEKKHVYSFKHFRNRQKFRKNIISNLLV